MILFKGYSIRSMTKKLKVMQQNRLHNQPSDDVLAKEISLYQSLATIYQSLIGDKKYPFAALMLNQSLRAAASLGDSAAQYTLAVRLLDEAKFREQLEKEILFANSINQHMVEQCYQEAHAWLLAAENFGHVLAKRLHGMCYINGWGVAVDKNKGFELVVKSIEQENTWEQVPQIFSSLGLNTPEFFAALVKHRGEKTQTH